MKNKAYFRVIVTHNIRRDTMVEMIREKEIDQGLWETYVRLLEEERAITG